ncbi:hypothetical protein TNCV_3327531 [Trichonephila clavipes]|nr:hypothetical protein TNCV_3327531 [Trichonephila clavipes]
MEQSRFPELPLKDLIPLELSRVPESPLKDLLPMEQSRVHEAPMKDLFAVDSKPPIASQSPEVSTLPPVKKTHQNDSIIHRERSPRYKKRRNEERWNEE